jgi:hypothetical protein
MTSIASLLWALSSAAEARRWRRAARDAAAAQREVLLRIVRTNAGSEFGREHGFDAIDSVAAYQRRVPLRSFDDFRPYIDRIAAGAPRVLTSEEVVRFGVTSGSTSGSKLVPYTRSLFDDFRHGIDAWIWHLFREYPAAILGKSYWSVTPVGQGIARSSGGIPIGFDDERPFFGRLTRRLLAATMAAPPELAHLRDMDTFRYATLRFLLQEGALSWVSVWNPTFLTLLLEPLWEWRQSLIDDVRAGTLSRPLDVSPRAADAIRAALRADPRRADELAQAFADRTPELYERLWPHLLLISCWADGAAADTIPLLASHFPNAVIQPKGLLATEAFISFPYRDRGSALSLRSHFFEFESVDDADSIRLAHELTIGARYSVIVTTSGGLYRYRMHDIIEVIGHVDQCPLIRFVGRADAVVDLRGEKLHEIFAAEAVRRTLEKHGTRPPFAMLAPNQNGDGYVLFIQADVAPDLAIDLDQALRDSFQYDYCRRLGQLQQCSIMRLDPEIDAAARYVQKCANLGQRLGHIKPTTLHSFRGWAGVFGG